MKELNGTERTVCDLIALAAFHKPRTFSAEIDWQAVYNELSCHAILGVFRDTISFLNLPKKIREDWENQNYCIIARGAQVGTGQTELTQLLDGNGIPYAILKGTSAAQYYPIKYSRSLGDVDFIVKEEDYKNTQKLLEENGYVNAFEYEDNYRHESFNKNGVHYECHHLFADNSFTNAKKIDEQIISDIDNAIKVKTELGQFMCLPASSNGLVLLEHIAIHIKAGLGLRQILDWLFFAEKNLDDEGWAGENGRVIRETGLDTLAKTIAKAGQLFFGFNPEIKWCADASENLCGELIWLVFSYGNFGCKNTIDDKVIGVARRYRRGILKNLKTSGEHNWKVLHKYPWLKPLAPLYQIGRYTKQMMTRKGAIKALLRSKEAVDERERLMIELGI